MIASVPVRQDILTSWQRSVVAGLRPDHFQMPYQPDLDDDGPLRWAATPILDQVADELDGARVGLPLTDARGQVVDRRAPDSGTLARLDHIELAPGFLYSENLIGTNAIGTAIAQQAPSVVTGTEHFADALTSMACAAIPVTDGAGEMIGVIDLTCAAQDFNPLLVPFAKRAARDIGHRLRDVTGPGLLFPRSWLNLTATEREVAQLAAQGLSSRVVAVRTGLPGPTVRAHLRRVFRKLDVVLSLSVRDDGVGGADPGGSGLTGLRERAAALGGALTLTSPPGRGTRVDVKLPAAAR
jgi:transcriptional regulator of acetoin/glycerol metabolism